jgi:hypothetical protein
MAAPHEVDTHQKALAINLDPYTFGSFAEIGAGQEVARWFLTVGGASGTVAKTISAYDKEVSDDLYGAGTRYVSKERLQAMMEIEWKLLLSELQKTRGEKTRFFAFVDTVSARNFSGTNECHGWVGLRFQLQPGGPANEVILHVNLQDHTNLQQQDAVGVLGVNLIHAAFYSLGSPEKFLAAVFEDLGLLRMEMDLVELSGPAFESWDRRKLHVSLVTDGYAEAVVFRADGKQSAPTELLYKKVLVLAPGSFETTQELHGKLLETTLAQLPKEQVQQSKGSLGLFCLSGTQAGQAQGLGQRTNLPEELLHRVDELLRFGDGILVFRAHELYTMSAFVSRYTQLQVHFAVGLTSMINALHAQYKNLAGSVLEGMARLFTYNVRLSVFPMPEALLKQRLNEIGAVDWKYKVTDGMVYTEDLQVAGALSHLHRYLMESGLIRSVRSPKA